jgi:hypothetical protein
MGDLWKRVGVTPRVEHPERPDPEQFYLSKLEEGLGLIGDKITKRDIQLLKVEISNSEGLSPDELKSTVSSKLQGIGATGEEINEAVDRYVKALKAAFDNDISQAGSSEDTTKTISLKEARVNVASQWVSVFNELHDVCRRPMLVGPAELWVQRHGAKKVLSVQMKAARLGCLPAIALVGAILVLIATVFG